MAIDGTKGTPKDDGANKANNPNMPDRGTTPESNKQCFPFWSLLNFILHYLLVNPIFL